MTALPQAAFFLLLEAAAGGAISLFWLHARGEVGRGFTLFTGVCYVIAGALALWIRVTFPPTTELSLGPGAQLWFAVERTAIIAMLVLFGAYLVLVARRPGGPRVLAPLIPLLALASLWSAALVESSPQAFGLGTPLAVLAGALALGSALTGLSLGHWYLVSPTLSTNPLVRVNFLCLAAVGVQAVLALLLVLTAPDAQKLLNDYGVFLGVRLVFGLVVPIVTCVMTWRTARMRSLDSATGLLYISAALILAGEIAARTLFFLTGVST